MNPLLLSVNVGQTLKRLNFKSAVITREAHLAHSRVQNSNNDRLATSITYSNLLCNFSNSDLSLLNNNISNVFACYEDGDRMIFLSCSSFFQLFIPSKHTSPWQCLISKLRSQSAKIYIDYFTRNKFDESMKRSAFSTPNSYSAIGARVFPYQP